jgi:hypothetical protein
MKDLTITVLKNHMIKFLVNYLYHYDSSHFNFNAPRSFRVPPEYHPRPGSTVQKMVPRLAPSKVQLICDMLKTNDLLNVSQIAGAAECSLQSVYYTYIRAND